MPIHHHGQRAGLPQLRGRDDAVAVHAAGLRNVLQHRLHRNVEFAPRPELFHDCGAVRDRINDQHGSDRLGSRVPVPTSTSDAAATAIGQAQVVVSPLTMANVAATVDSGSVHLPRLVSGAPDDSTPPQTVNPTVVSDLRTMMNAVVTSSVGTAASAGLPAGTFGKTGTAEFGMANPPQTDAWFIGYNGDLAFAVLVVGGGVGGAGCRSDRRQLPRDSRERALACRDRGVLPFRRALVSLAGEEPGARPSRRRVLHPDPHLVQPPVRRKPGWYLASNDPPGSWFFDTPFYVRHHLRWLDS